MITSIHAQGSKGGILHGWREAVLDWIAKDSEDLHFFMCSYDPDSRPELLTG
jgi:hypothetical protein